jgi:hypothetical protein
MLISDLITASFRKLGIAAKGETLDSDDLANGLAALQSMLRSWTAARINVFASTRENFSIIAGISNYTWGSGGTINSARPLQILGAEVRDSEGVSHPVDIISEGQYRSISVKSTSSRPYALMFQPIYPLANVYFYPTPYTAETVYIDSIKQFTEASSFDSVNATLAMPGYYEEPILYNLAARLAPEYGKTLTPEVLAIAASSYERLAILNIANQVEPVSIRLPAGQNVGMYSINSDTYR